MNKDYMLKTDTARKIYASVKALPIVDYHCHLSPQEIYEDKPFDNIGEIWLAADHYKWRLMRTAGIDEEYITGNTPFNEKFIKYCSALEFAAGNPLYHWSHMELSQFFGIDMPINSRNAEEIWEKANAFIKETAMSPRKLIEKSNVEVICTTDDITDDLSWHKKIAEDKDFKTKVIPSQRQMVKDRFKQLIEHYEQNGYELPPPVNDLFLQLAEQLKSVRGKKVYGYLPKEVKETVDKIVVELAKDKDIAELYSKWNEINREKLSLYSEKKTPDIPLEDNKEFRSIKNVIVKAAVEFNNTQHTKKYTPRHHTASRQNHL